MNEPTEFPEKGFVATLNSGTLRVRFLSRGPTYRCAHNLFLDTTNEQQEHWMRGESATLWGFSYDHYLFNAQKPYSVTLFVVLAVHVVSTPGIIM
jgi:hypothetical protein